MKLSELNDDVRGEFGIAEDVEGVAVLYVSPAQPQVRNVSKPAMLSSISDR